MTPFVSDADYAELLRLRAILSPPRPLPYPRDGYGRCQGCGGPFEDGDTHTSTCPYRAVANP